MLIVDDHSLLADSLTVALRLRGVEQIVIAEGGALHPEGILAAVDEHKPDVVLLDLFLGAAGPSHGVIPAIVERGATVLVLTASQDPVALARCIEGGATGVFDKASSFDTLVSSLLDAASGRSTMRPAAKDELLAALASHRRDTRVLQELFGRLTDRERAVLQAIIDGENAEAIAEQQIVAVSTVRSHIRSILEKLGVNSQLAAVALARRAGWPDDARRA